MPKNNTPDKALLLAREVVAKMKEADDAHHTAKLLRAGEYDDITEVRLVLAGVNAALSQHQHGGLVEGMQRAAAIARDFAEQTNEDGVLLHKRECISAANEISHRIIAAALSNSPVVGEDVLPLAFYDASDRDRRIADLADALEKGNGRVSIVGWRQLVSDLNAKPTLTDTADRREAVARILHDTIENDDDSGGGAYLRAADALIAASLIAVPDGMALVPREPTEAMLKAALPDKMVWPILRTYWSAMIAARPGAGS